MIETAAKAPSGYAFWISIHDVNGDGVTHVESTKTVLGVLAFLTRHADCLVRGGPCSITRVKHT